MDGSAFRNLDFGWMKWLFLLAGLGVLTLLAGAGLLLWFLLQHVTIAIAF